MHRFKSRKFILAVLGALIGIVNAVLEAYGGPSIDTESLLAIIAPLIAFILGESYVDGTNRR